jgi:tetratricopeptide (TPR) repeat protein
LDDDRAHGRIPLLAILLYAAATRVLYFGLFVARDPLHGYLLHDARQYEQWATALATGLAWEPGPFYQAPLYPYLVSLAYRVVPGGTWLVLLLQLGAGLLLIGLVHRVAARTFGAAAATFAAALAALYGVFPFYETKLLPATLAAVLGLLALDRLQLADRSGRPGPFAVAGVVSGALIVANPGSLLLLPLLAPWFLLDRARGPGPRLLGAGAFGLGVVLVVAPVTVRNAVVGGETVLVSVNGGVNLHLGNNARAEGVISTPAGFSGSIFDQRQEARALAEAEAGRPLSDGEVSRHWTRQALGWIRARPLDWVGLLGRKLALSLDDYEHALEYNPQLDPNPARWLMPLPFALILGLACARPFAGGRPTRAEALLYLMLAGQLAVLLAFFVSGRFRLGAVPLLLVLAGAGAAELGRRLRDSSRSALVPALAILAIAAASWLVVPLLHPGLVAREEARGLSDLALAWEARGDRERALRAYDEALERNPADALTWLDRGTTLQRAGRAEEAEASLRKAIELAPASAEAWHTLGYLLAERARLAEAAVAYERAARLMPGDPAKVNNLIGTLLQLGRHAPAIEAWREARRRGVAIDDAIEGWMRANGMEPPAPGSAQ